MIPAGLRVTREHVWVRVDKSVVTLGVTQPIQERLGDIVFVDLPDLDRKVKAGEHIITLETVDGPTEMSCPVSGTITEVNEELVQHPEKVNESPYEEGWIVKLKVGNPDLSKLMDAAAYEKYAAESK
jgi:glycine cleavage system H protein